MSTHIARVRLGCLSNGFRDLSKQLRASLRGAVIDRREEKSYRREGNGSLGGGGKSDRREGKSYRRGRGEWILRGKYYLGRCCSKHQILFFRAAAQVWELVCVKS